MKEFHLFIVDVTFLPQFRSKYKSNLNKMSFIVCMIYFDIIEALCIEARMKELYYFDSICRKYSIMVGP